MLKTVFTDMTTAVTTALENTGEASPDVFFEPMNFLKNLGYLAEGMLGIAIVMGLIVGMIFVLNKIFKKG